MERTLQQVIEQRLIIADNVMTEEMVTQNKMTGIYERELNIWAALLGILEEYTRQEVHIRFGKVIYEPKEA